jgi:hypothetical protein
VIALKASLETGFGGELVETLARGGELGALEVQDVGLDVRKDVFHNTVAAGIGVPL